MLLGRSEDPLHDGRIAIRRLRSCLRLFSQFIPLSSSRFIDDNLADLAQRLSPLRDNDVWMVFLSRLRLGRAFLGSVDFIHYCSLEASLKKSDRKTMRDILKSEDYASLMRFVNRFLRVEIPEKIKRSRPQTLASFAARRLAAIYFEVLACSGVRKKYNVKKMHGLRKLCRRGRYWSEFLNPFWVGLLRFFTNTLKILRTFSAICTTLTWPCAGFHRRRLLSAGGFPTSWLPEKNAVMAFSNVCGDPSDRLQWLSAVLLLCEDSKKRRGLSLPCQACDCCGRERWAETAAHK